MFATSPRVEAAVPKRSAAELEHWRTFSAFINDMIKQGHGEKVAVGLTGYLMGVEANVDAAFAWAEIYFKDEITNRLMSAVGPQKGDTVH